MNYIALLTYVWLHLILQGWLCQRQLSAQSHVGFFLYRTEPAWFLLQSRKISFPSVSPQGIWSSIIHQSQLMVIWRHFLVPNAYFILAEEKSNWMSRVPGWREERGSWCLRVKSNSAFLQKELSVRSQFGSFKDSSGVKGKLSWCYGWLLPRFVVHMSLVWKKIVGWSDLNVEWKTARAHSTSFKWCKNQPENFLLILSNSQVFYPPFFDRMRGCGCYIICNLQPYDSNWSLWERVCSSHTDIAVTSYQLTQ